MPDPTDDEHPGPAGRAQVAFERWVGLVALSLAGDHDGLLDIIASLDADEARDALTAGVRLEADRVRCTAQRDN